MSEQVMMTNYVKETDPERQAASNRTYERLIASLDPAVAARYGYIAPVEAVLVAKCKAAFDAGNWKLVKKLSAELQAKSGEPKGKTG